MPVQPIFTIYFLAISLLTAVACAADKYFAKKGMWRIPEKMLLLLCALGGAAAMLLTMRAVRHKTRKPKFTIGVPLILLLQFAAFAITCFSLRGA